MRSPPRPCRRPLGAVLPAFLAAATSVGSASCTEDALTNLPPDGAPGSGAATVEVVLPAARLAAWDDTTYSGFVLPSGAAFLLAAEESGLRSRILGRFEALPDTVQVDTVRRAVVSFDSARFRLLVDTLRSVFPPEGSSRLVEARSLARGFDARRASWTEATPGEPWATPGGDLDVPLGSFELSGRADTVRIPLAVNADSLLTSWRSDGGEPGFALLLEGGDGRLAPTNVALEIRLRLEGIDTLVTQLRSASPATFIFDPTPPPAGLALRLGGVPSTRGYVRFAPPERAAGAPLRGSTINRAEVVLQPLAPPGAPFALERAANASAIRLLADPFDLGEKTPIGATLGTAALDPDSLTAGRPVVFDVTALLREWAAARPDSIPELRIGFRVVPEGAELGAWDFGSSQSVPGARPVLRLLVTPPTEFQLP